MEKYKVSFSRSRHCYSLENIFNVKHVKKVTCMRKDRDVVLERCAIWCVCVCMGAGGGGVLQIQGRLVQLSCSLGFSLSITSMLFTRLQLYKRPYHFESEGKY